jgi:hypothetical protein
MFQESDDERDQRRLVEFIERKRGTATVREVHQGCRWLKRPAGAAESALNALRKAGMGEWCEIPTTEKGGRPSHAFKLFRFAHVYETPTQSDEKAAIVDVDNVEESESHEPKEGSPTNPPADYHDQQPKNETDGRGSKKPPSKLPGMDDGDMPSAYRNGL